MWSFYFRLCILAISAVAQLANALNPRGLASCFDKGFQSLMRPGKLRYSMVLPTKGRHRYGTGIDLLGRNRSMGSCALVGNGPSLVGASAGEEIDAHDTIIRFTYSSELKKLDEGERMDILVKRTCDFGISEYNKANRLVGASGSNKVGHAAVDMERENKLKAYITSQKFCKRATHKWKRAASPFRHTNGVPILYWDCLNTQALTCPLMRAHDLFRNCGRRHHPHSPGKGTSGWCVGTFLIQSGLCTKLSLYGFSKAGVSKNKIYDFGHASASGTTAKATVYNSRGVSNAAKMLHNPRGVTHSLDVEYAWWKWLERRGAQVVFATIPAKGGRRRPSPPPPPPVVARTSGSWLYGSWLRSGHR